jgi:hypothetical protein
MESNEASLAVIGIDIGKEVFHIVGLGVDGKIAFRRKIRRLGLKDAFEKLPPCIVGMEACGWFYSESYGRPVCIKRQRLRTISTATGVS